MSKHEYVDWKIVKPLAKALGLLKCPACGGKLNEVGRVYNCENLCWSDAACCSVAFCLQEIFDPEQIEDSALLREKIRNLPGAFLTITMHRPNDGVLGDRPELDVTLFFDGVTQNFTHSSPNAMAEAEAWCTWCVVADAYEAGLLPGGTSEHQNGPV